jgi:HAMP domain-containing protein
MTEKRRDLGLIGRIGCQFVGLIVLVGVIIGTLAYTLLGRTLWEEYEQRASVITANLSDAAAAHMMSRDVLQLNVLLTKYARLSGVAYAFIKDRNERVIAHSSAAFSAELQEGRPADLSRQTTRRVLTLQGKRIHETQMPILEGQLGTAYVGVWGDAVEPQVYRALLMLMAPISGVLLIAIGIAIFLALRLVRPFRRLTDVAGRISSGDLDTPVRVESQHEFGELTRSLERMRASLKAATVRLGRTGAGAQGSVRSSRANKDVR